MRIAQAIALYAPDFQGGATLVCRRLSRALADRGHVLDVFAGRTTAAEPIGAIRTDPVDGIATWRVNLGGAFHPWSREGWDDPPAQASFARFLAERRPDIVHLHGLQALGVGVIDAAAAASIPVVWTMHDWWWLCPCLFRLAPGGGPCSPIPDPERCFGHAEVGFADRRAALARALRQVARVLTPTAFLRDSLIANGLAADLVQVQENGIEPPAPGFAARRAARVHRDALHVVFVGGAGNREKGLEVLREAAARLRSADVLLRLYAVDAAEPSPWRGPARVEFLPGFSPGGLDDALAEADVVVVPSLMRESCSLVTREALVRGIPVVTSDCGGPEEVLRDGVNGLVFDTGSVTGLAAALDRLAGDRGLLDRLAASPPPALVTPAGQARAAEALYREVLREAERARPAPVRPAVGPIASGGSAGSAPVPAPASASASTAPPRSLPRARLRSVLFLAGVDGAPLRYRVWHLVERLALRGVRSEVLHHSDARARAAAEVADCIVLARAPFAATVAAVVANARRRGVPVVFSADDLVFSEADCDAAALSDPREEIARGFRWTLDAYGRSLAASDAFLGSTEELVDTARSLGVPGLLVRNGLGRALLERLDAARHARVVRDDDPARRGAEGLRIGFLTGTDTHDRDLASIAAPLQGVLHRLPDARLVVAGPATLPAQLAESRERIERLPLLPWSEFPRHLAGLDVCVVPLERPNRFNEAKSEVKFLEAALAGVAVVASPTLAFRTAIRDGETGLLAADAAAWEAALLDLAGDPERRRGMARRARRDVVFRYGPHVQSDPLVDGLLDIVERGPRARSTELPAPIELDGGDGSVVALEPADSPYDAWQFSADAGATVGPARAVEQDIPVHGPGVCRVDVLVGTFWRRNDHLLELSVFDESGRELGRREVEAGRLVDRTHVSVEFDRPSSGGAGSKLRLRAEAPGAGPGNEVLLWHGPSHAGELRVGGEVVAGRALAFRSFGEGA